MSVLAPKTLVFFPGALGDFLCFYPALEWLLRKEMAGALEIRLRPDLGRLLRSERQSVRPLDSPEVRSLFVSNSRTDPLLQDFFDGFDAIYSWTGFKDETFRENLMTLAPGKARLFPFRPETSRISMSDYYLSCVGGVLPERSLRLSVRREASEWAATYLKDRELSDVPLLALAAGSGAVEKNWPSDRFAAIGEWWHAYAKGRALFTVGPVERERPQNELRSCSGALCVDDLSLDQLAALFHRCRAMVGNDSGPTHLAGAIGIPTFAIFGPTDPVQWKPWGPKVTVVTSDVSCAPCGARGMKACAHRSCLDHVQPEVLIRLLKENLFDNHLDK